MIVELADVTARRAFGARVDREALPQVVTAAGKR
jgi:hypothetical protein